ncbi:MAG: TetR/AcrR family transcriptional regulator [Bilophila wadsworthia]
MAQQTKCRKKTEARREAILDAALEEFAAKGYAGARMEDIARRAGVAKGTLYLHFGDKEGLFNGLAESAFAPMHALAKEILGDKTPTLRERLLRFCGPMLDEQGCSRTARIIRLVWAEGLHNPKLVAPFYHGLVAPILELHRENLRLAAHEHPHPAPSGSAARLADHGGCCSGSSGLAPSGEGTVYRLSRHYPAGKIRDLCIRQTAAPPEAPGGCRKRVPAETWVFHAGNAVRLP